MQSLMTVLPSASPSTSVPHLPDGRFFSPQDMAFFAHTVQQTNFSNMTQIEDLTIDDNSNSFDSLDLHNPSAQMEETIASTNNGVKRLESADCIILDSPKPSPRTPSTSASCSSLTRARGELLRRKIEQRPSRERLVTQRILLSDGRVAPLIEQKARLLKKDRIRSSLDKKLSRRPGPLELVTKKILIADAELERDIEEGRLLFKPIESEDNRRVGRGGMHEFDDALSPITLDMEVLPNALPRPLSKPVNVLMNKGLMRKTKPSPYKTAEPMPVKPKTKSFDNKEDAYLADKKAISEASSDVEQNSNYKLLLQQQQLFLQYQQNEDQTDLSLSNGSPDMPPLSSPPNNLVSSTNQILRPAPRRLSCMKVSELKNECKKRNLPVSGPKPHLVDRLRIYEREILGCTPAPSPEPSETSLPSVVNGTSSSSQSVMMIDNQNGGMVSEANTIQATSGIISCSSSSIPQSMQEAPSRPAQLTIHDYLTSQNQRSLVLLPPSGQQVVQVIDSKGQLLGMATMQCQPNIVPAGGENTVVLNRPITSDLNAQQPPPRLIPTTTRAVIQGKENTFRFAQMGSGGQFTVSPEMQSKIPVTPLPQSTQILGNSLVPGGPRQVIVQSVIPQSQVMLLHPAPGSSIQTIAPLQPQQPKLISQTVSQSPVVSIMSGQGQPNGVRLASPSVNGGSPRTADQAGSSPNLPPPNSVSSDCTSNVGMSTEIIEGEGTNDSPILIDNIDPSVLLTPQTLQKREELLRTQQKKIETLMREVADAQKMLKIEQELIIAAKKAQAKMREQQREQDQQDERSRWLKETDFGQMNKQHIQNFLHHKMLQSHIRKFSTEHNRLANTEVRLQEELHVEQAVHDIVRLIKQDPRTALLIVQLLRKFQVERQQEKDKAIVDEVHGVPNIVAQATKSRRSQNSQNKNNNNDTQSMECENGSEKPIDKMDEVFKSVLETATRETENITPPATECSLSTSFAKRSNSIHHWPSSSITSSSTSSASTSNASARPLPVQTVTQQLNETSMSASVATISYPQAAVSCSQMTADGTVEVFPQQGGSTQMSLSQVNYNEEMPEQMQNSIEEANQNCVFDEQNFDDIFEALDKDINGTLDWKFNMDSYGSQALTELLGPDAWLDDINRHIAQNGQYASFDVTEDESGRRTDPMCMGNLDGAECKSQPMDWMDEILQEEPILEATSTTPHVDSQPCTF